MEKKIFVGNLPFEVTDFELEDIFKEYGEVASAKVIVDRRTGRSRGFGFVEMGTEDGAQQAVEALNGLEVKGRAINVSFARKQESSDRGGDRGFGGGDSGFQRKSSYNNNY
ncbi:MAG: hypothetical protein A3B68_01190 [Candidatus Melainabacteria bacterium RIFCSPHIGHO2_02_FULL_34_12]|nr:MAG: hypothetical protein A3B68_01190 [Candidatus Melainabacteria bacterium RIFCSPHIGHO2_02_FULL_34_12]